MEVQAIRRSSLLLDRNFSSLWLAQAVSGFGDHVTSVALAVIVWQQTQSSFYTGLVVLVTTVPHAFFGFLAGPIADAVGKRRTLIACDVIRAGVVGALPVALGSHLPIAVLYLLVLLATLCAAVFNPTRLAILPELMPHRTLASGNSLFQITDRVVEIAGKAAGGLLVLTAGANVFYIDAATFVFSVVMLTRIALSENVLWSRLSLREVLGDTGTGLHVMRNDPILFANLLFSLTAQASVAVLTTLTAVYLFRELNATPPAYGAAEAALAFGVIVFALAMPGLVGQIKKGRLVIAGFAGVGLSLIGMAVFRDITAVLLLFMVAGAANVTYLVANVTIYQERTPAGMRARVFGSRYALLNLTWIPVMVGCSLLAEKVDAGLLIGVAGAFTLVTAVAGLFIPAVRDVD